VRWLEITLPARRQPEDRFGQLPPHWIVLASLIADPDRQPHLHGDDLGHKTLIAADVPTSALNGRPVEAVVGVWDIPSAERPTLHGFDALAPTSRMPPAHIREFAPVDGADDEMDAVRRHSFASSARWLARGTTAVT
jgi:hypothetical protein